MTNPTTLEVLDRTLVLCQGAVFLPGTVSDLEIARTLLQTRVALVADARSLDSAACQSAIVALVRMALGYGCQVRLVMPEVERHGYQPPLRGEGLVAGLVDLGKDILPLARVVQDRLTDKEDLVFVFGDTEWQGNGRQAWRVAAGDWWGAISSVLAAAPAFEGDFPLGGLAAAAIAAAEPFKAAIREAGGTLRVPEEMEQVQTASFRLAPDGTPTSPVDLGQFDCISGGAIMNSALFALLRIPGATGDARIFEPESGDHSNLNRYPLMRTTTALLPKVRMLSEWQYPGLTVHGEEVAVDKETISGLRPLRQQILVGVDRVPARWLVQREWPTWLAVSGTDDFLVQSSEHTSGRPCAGCAYFDGMQLAGTPPPVATVSFVSFWAGLLLASRFVRRALGFGYGTSTQMAELTALRLDSRVAARWYEVPRRDDCPVGCQVARKCQARI